MNLVPIVFVAFFFSGYIFFDAMAVMARASASAMGRNAFGAAIEKVMNTLKRTMIFFYPPILGYFILTNDLSSIVLSIVSSYSIASILLTFLIVKRRFFLCYFCAVTTKFSNGASLLKSLASRPGDNCNLELNVGLSSRNEWLGIARINDVMKRPQLTILASWLYFIFGASIFAINILALTYSQYAPIILQCLGLVNGLGTVILAFLVDPIVSRYLDASSELDEISLTLLVAQLLACIAIAPVFFLVLLLLA